MPNSGTSSSRRTVVISPNSPMVNELEPLLSPHLRGAEMSRLQAYPSPRDLPTIVGGGIPNLVLLDAVSDRDQALHLLDELSRMPQVRVFALLGGNDPDFILRCLRAGASDFLIQPFTADQLDAAFGKLARMQPAAETPGREPAKIIAVYSFLDAIQRAGELDQDLWSTMVQPVHGVDVLLAPELMLESTHDLRDPSPILEYARH